MDTAWFDRLAAAWARRHSRRGTLALLGSGALSGGLGLARPQPAEARCRRATNCRRDRYRHCHNTSACLRVKNVDTGNCACIAEVAKCTATCTTSADCGGGLCVYGKGCCGETGMHCASPCPV